MWEGMKRIEICGSIAAGKTTLCQTLARQGFSSYFEQFQANPFWRDFYDDPIHFAFETELAFLLQHYHTIKKNISSSKSAFDFSLLQDLAYADINLPEKLKAIFKMVLDELLKEIGLPHLLIQLTCPPQIALQRIHQRKRDVESSITIEYLEALNSALDQRVASFSSTLPVLQIDSTAVDFRTTLPPILKKFIEQENLER